MRDPPPVNRQRGEHPKHKPISALRGIPHGGQDEIKVDGSLDEHDQVPVQAEAPEGQNPTDHVPESEREPDKSRTNQIDAEAQRNEQVNVDVAVANQGAAGTTAVMRNPAIHKITCPIEEHDERYGREGERKSVV